MPEHDDIALIEQCRAGNLKAFEKLIERHQKAIYNAALRMLNNREDAEDVTQEVFVKAFENLDAFKSEYKFFSWIYRMAINQSINLLRRRNRMQTLEADVLSPEKSPEQKFEEAQGINQMELALMFLTPEKRAIIILKHFHNLSYREIAYILEIQEKTVKSRLFEARQQLKKIYKKKGFVH